MRRLATSQRARIPPAAPPSSRTKDPWWDQGKGLLGNLLRAPTRVYKALFEYSRPDTTHKTIRAAEWAHLRSEWRFVHSIFVYVGRPTHIIVRCRLPLTINLLVALVLIVNEEARARCGVRSGGERGRRGAAASTPSLSP